MNAVVNRYRYWIAAAIGLLTLVLAVLLRDFTREAILIPIAQFVWLLNYYLKGLPQPLVWALFLLVTVYVAVSSLSQSSRSKKRALEAPLEYPGPVEAELKWIRLADYGSYGRWRLAQRLVALLVAAMAHRYRREPAEIKRMLASGKLEVPAAIRGYVQAGLGGPEARPSFSLLPGRARHPASPLATTSPYEVLSFIQTQVEEPHDD